MHCPHLQSRMMSGWEDCLLFFARPEDLKNSILWAEPGFQLLAPARVGTHNLLNGDLTPSSFSSLPSLQGTALEQMTQPGETESLRPGVLPAHLAWERGGRDSRHCVLRGGERGRGGECLLFLVSLSEEPAAHRGRSPKQGRGGLPLQPGPAASRSRLRVFFLNLPGDHKKTVSVDSLGLEGCLISRH